MNPSDPGRLRGGIASFLPLGIVFFLSGVPALLYQLCWQRMLFTVYGVNIESITVVVSAFMLGLGLGSLWGGRLASGSRWSPLLLFGWLEVTIAAFGLVSPSLFEAVTRITLGASLAATGVLSFALVLVPTLLMGASLPLLVAHLLRVSRNMGQAVGLLYFVNTLGSAAACFLAVYFTFEGLGLSGTIELAAALNALVAGGAFVVYFSSKASLGPESPQAFDASEDIGTPQTTPFESDVHVPFVLVLGLSALAGFISLAYEVVLARAYSFVSAGRASAFPLLLGWYLVGIAVGSLASGVFCARTTRSRGALVRVVGLYFLVVNVLGFFTIPFVAHSAISLPFQWTYPAVALLSGGLGATLPLVAHIGIEPDRAAPQRLSYVYVANIVGSTLGSLLTGFIAMDLFGLPVIVTALSVLGVVVACSLLSTSKGRFSKVASVVVAVAASGTLLLVQERAFFHMYEKLLFKDEYSESKSLRHVVESKSGVVTVTRGGMVHGGGTYDGQLSVDLVYDRSGIVRPFILSAFHEAPRRVLMIGLATGAWAQVLVHHPRVESLLAVEINPGYLEVIEKSDPVRSLLENEKFEVVIDDGRRFLARNPEERFDLIVMNTTFHWHSYAANLLSVEFLNEIERHLAPSGIAIYNTTSSPEAQRTGAVVFDHALRFHNNMIVSNDPLVPRPSLLRATLDDYVIDGRPVFLDEDHHRNRLEAIVGLLETFTTPPDLEGFETKASILARTSDVRLITDDNMGTEWTHDFEERDRK